MKRSLSLFALLCMFFCLCQTSRAQSASGKPINYSCSYGAQSATGKLTDYSCNYYDGLGAKYYCVETSAACNVAHAFVKESGSAASPTLIVLTYQGDSNGCQNYEGSMALPIGNIIVVHVISCGCGSSLTTHVFFARDLAK